MNPSATLARVHCCFSQAAWQERSVAGGGFEDFLGDVYRSSIAEGQGNGVAWAGVDIERLALIVQRDSGIERLLPQIVDGNALHADRQAIEDILHQVVGEGSVRRLALQGQ